MSYLGKTIRFFSVFYVSYFNLNIIFKGVNLFILNNVCKYFRLARTFTRISLKPRNEQILDYTFEWTLKIQHPSTRDVNVLIFQKNDRF